MKPFFSIIIPVYKVEKYLDECVQCVLAQTFTNYECILINDGSPDNCPAMCDEYTAKHKQIKVIHKENGGLSDARNVGIQAASGEYIVLLDSDDKFADNDTLQNLFDIAEKYKTDVILNVNWLTFTDNGEKTLLNKYDKNIVLASPKEVVQGFDKLKMIFAAWLFVLNKEYLIKNNLFFKKGLLHEDEHWMPRVLGTTKQIAINHSQFYAYRIAREGSIMANVSPKRLFDLLSIVDDLFEWSKDEETYGKDGCKLMLCQAKRICCDITFDCKDIKYQYKKEYRAFCIELRKRMSKIPTFYLRPRLLSAAIFGVSKTDALLLFYRKYILKRSV